MAYRDVDRDREVTVVERDRSSGAGVIVGVVLAVLAILLVWWLFLADGNGVEDELPDEVNVTVPVDVDVDEGATGGATDSGTTDTTQAPSDTTGG